VKKPVSVLRINAGTEERFKEINKACKVLRNPKGLEKGQKWHKR
jgi:curved DNA-binding protein CbpA